MQSSTKNAKAWLIWLIWMIIIAGLYFFMSHILTPTKPVLKTNDSGQIIVTRSPDGHFYIPGSINTAPIMFMVDTGASVVAVSDSFARQANLQGKQKTTLSTANGNIEGLISRAHALSLGNMQLQNIRVITGIVDFDNGQAQGLLGQNVLRMFDVVISGQQMTLTPRSTP